MQPHRNHRKETIVISLRVLAVAALLLAHAAPAAAALAVGAPAPRLSASAVLAGKPTVVDLARLARDGPVVIVFIPSVFNDGSAAEAREFAAAIERFHAAGATVIGISRDPAAALARFSVEACAGRFAMAFAAPDVVTAFDVDDHASFNTRTTYVIDRAGTIAFVYDDDDPSQHARKALAFVEHIAR